MRHILSLAAAIPGHCSRPFPSHSMPFEVVPYSFRPCFSNGSILFHTVSTISYVFLLFHMASQGSIQFHTRFQHCSNITLQTVCERFNIDNYLFHNVLLFAEFCESYGRLSMVDSTIWTRMLDLNKLELAVFRQWFESIRTVLYSSLQFSTVLYPV